MLEISRKITYFMLSNRSAVTVVRGLLELTIGGALLLKPLWARYFLFYLPLAILAVLGGVGACEALFLRNRGQRWFCGISAVVLLTAAVVLYFTGVARLPIYAVGVWAILDGIGFVRGCFVGEKYFPSRLLMLAAGIFSAAFGGILFRFSTRGFWSACDFLGWFFLALGLFSLTVSPLIWKNDR